MLEHTRAPLPPRALKSPATPPLTLLWARLPADRQRQLLQLLGRLLTRLVEARRLEEGGHD